MYTHTCLCIHMHISHGRSISSVNNSFVYQVVWLLFTMRLLLFYDVRYCYRLYYVYLYNYSINSS